MSNSASIKNFVDVGDPGAPIGSAPWCRASHVQLCAMKRKMDWEVRHLKYGLLEFKRDERWRKINNNNDQPFGSWEDYVQYPEPNGLGMPPESVKAVLETLNDAELLGTILAQLVEETPAALPLGANDRGLAPDKTRQPNMAKHGSESRTRRIAVLKRDHPDIAERLGAGEFKSVAAAWRVAHGEPAELPKPTALDYLRRAWSKASEDERTTFLGEVAP